MASFQYFIKCDQSQELETLLADTELDCFKDRIFDRNYCNLDGGGYVFVVESKHNGVSLGIRSGQEMIDFEGFKVIMDTNDKPKPHDFVRHDAIEGDYLALGDGNHWMIPLARKVESGCTHLPSNIIQVRKGEFVEVPLSKYAKLIHLANDIWDDVVTGFNSDEDTEYKIVNSDQKILEAFQEILIVNYDLEWFDISALKLMTSDNVTSVLYAMVDYKTLNQYIEDEKKK